MTLEPEPDRRGRTRRARLNGIDDVAVSDDRRDLTVYLFAPLRQRRGGGAPDWTGEVRVVNERTGRDVPVESVEPVESGGRPGARRLKVRLAEPGSDDPHTLRIISRRFDPYYSSLGFSFRAPCNDSDCAPLPAAADDRPEPLLPAPGNYLAKDYAGFRQLILDRVAVLCPDWADRTPADLGSALVDLMAFTADRLSYEQDAAAAEAYLATARKRVSVRRHLRLIDHRLHDGCNARAFVTVCVPDWAPLVDGAWEVDRRAVEFLVPAPVPDDLPRSAAPPLAVFEPLVKPGTDVLRFRPALETIRFHLWGDGRSVLRRGATACALRDEITPSGRQLVGLAVGDFLLFEEVIGRATGNAADADPARRHVVRLTRVTPAVDHAGSIGAEGQQPNPQPIVLVEWDVDDSLPFEFRLALVHPATCEVVTDVSVARGNVVLADHGQTQPKPIRLGRVPDLLVGGCCGANRPADRRPLPVPFEVELPPSPLTFAEPVEWFVHEMDRASLETSRVRPAARFFGQSPSRAEPALRVLSAPGLDAVDDLLLAEVHGSPLPTVAVSSGWANQLLVAARERWTGAANPTDRAAAAAAAREALRDWAIHPDLIDSGPDDRHVVLEIDEAGRGRLRFGDDECGRRPEPGESFAATVRFGGGAAGNVPAGAISEMRLGDPYGRTACARNPLPARGGIDPEPVTEYRRFVPNPAKADPVRAVAPEDYDRLVQQLFRGRVQRSLTTFRDRGLETEVRVAIDPVGASVPDAALLGAVAERLRPYRLVGHEVFAVPALTVPLLIGLTVCATQRAFRSEVAAAVADTLVGRGGYFAPDRWTFGRPLPLSQVIAAVRILPGVADVRLTSVRRAHPDPRAADAPPDVALDTGLFTVEAWEVIRVDVVQPPGGSITPGTGAVELDLRGGK